MAICEHYSHAKANGNKKRRRVEAEGRLESRKQRTANQQLKKLDIEGRIAKRERTRLEKLI